MVVEVPVMTGVFRVLVAAGSLDDICRDANTVNEQAVIAAPENISITSINLKHFLSWKPMSAVWGNVTYTVEVQGEFERNHKNNTWLETEHCLSISVPWCDVTNEIPTSVPYKLRVQAELGHQKSNWVEMSYLFHINSTVLIPPKINLVNRGFQLTMEIEDLGPSFKYYAFYWRKGTKDVNSLKTKRQTTAVHLTDVKPKSEYCAYVIAHAVPISRNSSSSMTVCITVKAQQLSSLMIGLICFFTVIFGLVLLSLLLWKGLRLMQFSCFPKVDIPEALMMIGNHNSRMPYRLPTTISDHKERKLSYWVANDFVLLQKL
ncbi:interleukin-20 receptor subunit beta [Pelodytes ibericus]